ncbi:hypothetical protein P152DRAFT_406398 [Eremomyces bilateralis CBS 781.70]|uniref:Uncharacterized protein n=1 Tax=Eremomyces bilateralis CBS 781.70 TaxID=1392243 RepID=A0A6G1FQI8_9PEZI|nr:uncharacterized protein P152DRAFT_406398 [Eremomyces bilateralis CBS 781.70]KAF1807970.1 hypothetical protein P152DRAFT_406398 [Eremomyces bilateralis CBS 781.70]
MASRTPIMRLVASARSYLTEAHPMARMPVTTRAHALNTSKYFRRAGRTTAALLIAMPVLLGWPIAAASMLKRTGI